MKKPGPIKSAILEWLGVPLDLSNGEFLTAWQAGPGRAGQTVNETTVLSLSAAWACTRLISESISTLPLHIYERTDNGRRRAVNHPWYHLLHLQPNAQSSATTFWESMAAAMLLRGNAWVQRQYMGNRLVALKFLAPQRLSVKSDKGRLSFKYKQDDGQTVSLDPATIWHVPGFSIDGRFGLSAISYGASVFGSALAAGEAANGTFERGLAPTVAFTIDRVIKAEQRAGFRSYIEEQSGALNAGKPVTLEAGMDAKTIGIPPKDAQLLESRTFSVEEVCRWFRVDPSMVGHGGKDSNFGTGLEQKLIGFLTFTLRPWLSRIEQAINLMLPPAERSRYYAEFAIDGLLRADSAARASFYSTMVNNGIMTRDEVRQLENLPTRGGNADVLTVQTAMSPLDALAASVTPPENQDMP